jgi:hypothetical protein
VDHKKCHSFHYAPLCTSCGTVVALVPPVPRIPRCVQGKQHQLLGSLEQFPLPFRRLGFPVGLLLEPLACCAELSVLFPLPARLPMQTGVFGSGELRRHSGSNALKSQDPCEGLKVLPLKAMECVESNISLQPNDMTVF